MAKFVDQAHELVDLIEAQMQDNERDCGSTFAPLAQHEVSMLLNPRRVGDDDPHILSEAEFDKLLKAIDAKTAEFELSLDDKQIRLRAKIDEVKREKDELMEPMRQAWGEALERTEEIAKQLRQAIKEGDEEKKRHLMAEDEVAGQRFYEINHQNMKAASAAEDDIKSAEQQFNMALRSEQLKIVEELKQLSIEKMEHDRAIIDEYRPMEELSQGEIEFFGSPMLADEAIQKQSLSIDLPAGARDYNPEVEVLRVALAPSGYELLDSGEQLHVISAVTAPPIDFAALRQAIDRIGGELADPGRWKSVRSVRGVAYEYETFDKSDPLGAIAYGTSIGRYPNDIKIQKRLKDGSLVDPIEALAVVGSNEAYNTLSSVCRVSGAQAVKDILIDGLGVKGIELPPERGRAAF